MKKIALLVVAFLVVSITNVARAQEAIKWHSVTEALEMQKKVKKPIFMDVYTVWCGPCKMLDAQTFSDATFAKFINENYIAVKFNGEGDEQVQFKGKLYQNKGYNASRKNRRNSVHDFTYALGVRAYPSMIVIQPDGKISHNIMGLRSASDLMNELKK